VAAPVLRIPPAPPLLAQEGTLLENPSNRITDNLRPSISALVKRPANQLRVSQHGPAQIAAI